MKNLTKLTALALICGLASLSSTAADWWYLSLFPVQ